MGSRRRPRRLVISTMLLSAVTIVILVAWLYFFYHGGPNWSVPSLPSFSESKTDHRPPDLEAGDPDSSSSTKTKPPPSSPPSDAASSTTSTAMGRASPGIAAAPTVRLRQGRYIGATLDGSRWYPKPVEVFRGIPFAETTAGKNRFRPPVPLGPSDDTFEAVALGYACPGANVTGVETTEAEDCLNLNVYRTAGVVPSSGDDGGETGPPSPQDAAHRLAPLPRLPVVIYVHGGGFNSGVATERNMASFVSWAKEPLIGINFNYRLGALGFLPSSLSAREGALNLGLKDQQLLFSWVRDNVTAFGGDPNNVTLMGLSAGAHSIGHHVMYYAQTAKPAPFAKVIMESGATTARSVLYPSHPRHETQFREFLDQIGIGNIPEKAVFPTLRKLPVDVLLNASQTIWMRYQDNVCWPFQPVIDGPGSHSASAHAVIPDLPVNLWRQGHHLRIPVLTGFNTNEGTLFIPEHADTDGEFVDFFRTLIPGLSADDIDTLRALYPDPVAHPSSSPYTDVPRGMGRQWARLDAAYSHYAYVCPVLQTAHFMATSEPPSSAPKSTRSGPPPRLAGAADAGANPPVYVYRYAAAARWGTANHGDEAPIVAHDLAAVIPRDKDDMPGIRAVADAMHSTWADFVLSPAGDPNHHYRRGDGGRHGDDDKHSRAEWPGFASPFAAAPGAGGRVLAPAGRLMVFGEGNDERYNASAANATDTTTAATPLGSAATSSGSAASSSATGRFSRKSQSGTAAMTQALSEADMERCRFWWDRVELSQGWGKSKKELAAVRGKL